jgi:hypothetical protein
MPIKNKDVEPKRSIIKAINLIDFSFAGINILH